ncbi:DMT family transporter [Pseudoalteromonas sp. DL2-H2.2]|uniref:DMT family transporter n=1 Tax=Pseudoalteromonas sp. DL2-H2.2 TaxID=2908889 RepID=UPI001F366948|nr:DMT family transporter [Pseudoalteromonas sp. DL2-H2.2]MCF2909881.1 DMT family transporter [Pseudoalteromonas sp. DL2-H2.2]
MNTPIRTTVMMLICVFCWGSVFPVAKDVLLHMSGLSLSIWRFAIALISLFIFIRLTRMRMVSLSLSRYLILGIIGVMGVGGLNLALFSGLSHTSATNGALIMALSPIVTTVMAALLSRTLIARVQLLQLAIAFGGVLLVVVNGDLMSLLNLQLNQGDLTIMLGMLAWSGYTVCGSKVSGWLPPLEFSLLTMAAGLIGLSVASVFQAEVHPVQELIALPWQLLISMLYIGVFGTVVGYLCWNNGVKILGSANASLYFNLVPVFAALVSLLMGQSVTVIQLAGMLIVLTGLTLPLLIKRIKRNRTATLPSNG